MTRNGSLSDSFSFSRGGEGGESGGGGYLVGCRLKEMKAGCSFVVFTTVLGGQTAHGAATTVIIGRLYCLYRQSLARYRV